jgi:hypothetical protein
MNAIPKPKQMFKDIASPKSLIVDPMLTTGYRAHKQLWKAMTPEMPALPAMPKSPTTDTAAQAEEEMMRLRRRRGRASTFLTAGM